MKHNPFTVAWTIWMTAAVLWQCAEMAHLALPHVPDDFAQAPGGAAVHHQ